MKTSITDNGIVQVTTGEATWVCNNPDQANKHIPTWTDERRDNRPSEIIAPGDVSAIRDCASDYARMKREGRGAKPSRSWVYENGEVREITPLASNSPTIAPAENPVVASLARRILAPLTA